MRNQTTEMIDLALTQAIERYLEMEPSAVQDAIAMEWPEQLAVLLVEFMFKTTCGGTCAAMPDFIQIERENGHSNYVVLLCSCDTKLPVDWGDR